MYFGGKMKKRFFYVILLFLCMSLVAENEIESLLKGKDISFQLVNPSGHTVLSVRCNDGIITCNYGTSYIYLESTGNIIIGSNLYIDYAYTVFNLYGTPAFRYFDFPKFYEIVITEEQIKKRIESKDFKIIPDTSKEISGVCQALIICDNLRVRESPSTQSTTKIVGKLNKWDKVTAISCSDTTEKIDNLEFPWYKIRLKDGTEGWVFGGFAKLYFDDEDLQLLYKAFEKEGSEYTNQFLTPDNS